MSPERARFLSVRFLPACLSAEETAWLLGVSEHDLPLILKAGLLKPLGHTPVKGVRHFALADVLLLREDVKRLHKLADARYHHWRTKNGLKQPPGKSGPIPGSHRRQAAAILQQASEKAVE